MHAELLHSVLLPCTAIKSCIKLKTNNKISRVWFHNRKSSTNRRLCLCWETNKVWILAIACQVNSVQMLIAHCTMNKWLASMWPKMEKSTYEMEAWRSWLRISTTRQQFCCFTIFFIHCFSFTVKRWIWLNTRPGIVSVDLMPFSCVQHAGELYTMRQHWTQLYVRLFRTDIQYVVSFGGHLRRWH